jgi:lipid-A-disaccharide synthase
MSVGLVTELLIVAGEASGDRAVAHVLARLPGVRAFGMGGPAARRVGAELLCDLRQTTAMGFADVAFRLPSLALARNKLLRAAKERRPRAALLFNYSEFNASLLDGLRKQGIPTLFYSPPQVWAWRSGRARELADRATRFAVILPFEKALWEDAGADVEYVGHPGVETEYLSRVEARDRLTMTAAADAIAILPGSRPEEVERLLPIMLEGFAELRADRASIDARVLVASSLDSRTVGMMRQLAAEYEVDAHDVDPLAGISPLLPAFDVALTASGTATLEAAVAGVAPVVAHRVGAATGALARLFIRTPHIALPNILLERRIFPELVQGNVTAKRIREALEETLDGRERFRGYCTDLADMLKTKDAPSVNVARMLDPWLHR